MECVNHEQYRDRECASLTHVNVKQFCQLLWFPHKFSESFNNGPLSMISWRHSVTSRFCPVDGVATCHNLLHSPFWKAWRPWGTSLKSMMSLQYVQVHYKNISKVVKSKAWFLKDMPHAYKECENFSSFILEDTTWGERTHCHRNMFYLLFISLVFSG